MSGAPEPSRLKRGLAWFGFVLAAIVVTLGTVLGVAYSVANTDWGRRELASRASVWLSESYAGTIRIDHVGYVGLDGVSGVDGNRAQTVVASTRFSFDEQCG